MGTVEIKGDDPYMAEALVGEIAGRLKGEKGEEWKKLFDQYGAKHGVTIGVVERREEKKERKTQRGKFELPDYVCPVPVAHMKSENPCEEHEWQTEHGDETFEARCVKCGYFYRFEVYE